MNILFQLFLPNMFNTIETQKALQESAVNQLATSTELKKKLKTITEQCDQYAAKIKILESSSAKQDVAVFITKIYFLYLII